LKTQCWDHPACITPLDLFDCRCVRASFSIL
jgi:hypothetical protein